MPMAGEKTLTKHPQGKTGVNNDKAKYDQVKAIILDCLKKKEMTHMELTKCLEMKLESDFNGSINWYSEVVRLDLEAKIIIERVKTKESELYRISKK